MDTSKQRKFTEERFGKCQICLENIPVEYYFSLGDEIVCYECGTTYKLISKKPIKLEISGDFYDQDDYFGDLYFNE